MKTNKTFSFQFFVSFQLNRIATDLLQNQGVGASPYNPVEPGRFSAPPLNLSGSSDDYGVIGASPYTGDEAENFHTDNIGS